MNDQATISDAPFSVYILHCGDGSYYTGIALDVDRRIEEHQCSSRGAKYLKGRGPLSLVFSAIVGDRSAVSRAEYRIKKLDRGQKQALIDGRIALPDLLA